MIKTHSYSYVINVYAPIRAFSSLKIVTVMWCMPRVIHWAEYTKVKASLKYRETITCTKLTTIKVANRKNKMAALASDWLRHRTSPLKPLNRIQRGCRGQSVKRWNIVLRCTICGPFGLLFISRNDIYFCVCVFLYFVLDQWAEGTFACDKKIWKP